MSATRRRKRAVKQARKVPRKNPPRRKRQPPRFPTQGRILGAHGMTASVLARRCRISYIRARDLRAGRVILHPLELDALPDLVQRDIRAALPKGAAVNKGPQLALPLPGPQLALELPEVT